MELFNLEIENVSVYAIDALFHSESYEEASRVKALLIHWLPIDYGVPCQVVMPDASITEGIAEKTCAKLKPDTIVQFERFGFVRVDSINKKLVAYYAHK